MNLSDRLDAPPAEGWRPEPGEKLVGRIVEITEGVSDYGAYPLLVIEPEGGPARSVHGFHTVLRNELARLAPAEGDLIGIVYEGKKESKKGGGSYESYRVVLERATPRAVTEAPARELPANPEFDVDDEEPF